MKWATRAHLGRIIERGVEYTLARSRPEYMRRLLREATP